MSLVTQLHHVKRIRLILGDQLNAAHSWFARADKTTLHVMMEVTQETSYVKHHIQKVVAFFLAMRLFAESLSKQGHLVYYLTLDDPRNKHSFSENLKWIFAETESESFEYQYPDEYRLDEQLKNFCKTLSLKSAAVDTEHFLTSRDFLRQMFADKKSYLLETFYRAMRKKFNVLMDGPHPMGGAWNFDSENRKKLPSSQQVPVPRVFCRDVSAIYQMLTKAKVFTFGSIDVKNFTMAVTREEGIEILRHFCEHQLPWFGTYQDAMDTRYRDLFHSRLSFLMNSKLISPLEVVRTAINAWEENKSRISLPQIEGFVRQIVGWREYMRGIYWAEMPAFATLNYFKHDTPLPVYFWDGKTKMRCMAHALGQSLEYAYAHHIQRLMIIGNFALLAGLDPDQVDQWYLGVYVDAIEWVEITNTRGMSQYADGGIVGTKPYVGSANYINKMSNYCKSCFYDAKKRHGEKACPFNSLYWNFYERHKDLLHGNPRIGMAYQLLEKIEPTERKKIRQQAQEYLGNLDKL